MTDALCGPSNALSSFQKHTQADRTLQQDRLVGSRHSPAQGFRSFDPRVGSLDAEFDAFENAPTNPFQLEQPVWHQRGPASPAQSTSNWATDFQNLWISNSPIPAHQFRSEAPLVKTAPGGWQQEFLRQRQNGSSLGKQKQPEAAPQSFMQPASASQMPQLGFLDKQNTAQHAGLAEPQFTDAEFEQAFQDVFDHIQVTEAQVATHGEEAMEEPVFSEQEAVPIHEPSATKIGSDAIQYTETNDRSVDQASRDASDLARVAGELVHNVSHETNDKFKNSQFLDLMRRIRDREVEVRNNDFEATTNLESTRPQEQQPLPPEQQTSFQFPNMNEVYRFDESLDPTVDDEFQFNPPRTQMSDLHPGGPLYPEQSPPQPRHAQMSGAVDSSATADDPTSRYAQA